MMLLIANFGWPDKYPRASLIVSDVKFVELELQSQAMLSFLALWLFFSNAEQENLLKELATRV